MPNNSQKRQGAGFLPLEHYLRRDKFLNSEQLQNLEKHKYATRLKIDQKTSAVPFTLAVKVKLSFIIKTLIFSLSSVSFRVQQNNRNGCTIRP